jgi:hypothetical protein
MPDTNFSMFPDLNTVGLRRLGPACVTAPAGRQVEVEAQGRRVLATLAVAALYTPVPGDSVLLIEAGDGAYVIGVLQASGPMTITAPGDLRVLAPNGKVTLAAGAVSMEATEVTLKAERLAMMADQLRERFRNVRRVVLELLDVDAGAFSARVTDMFSVKARRVQAAAEEDVKIDGKQIHLG